MYVVNSRRPKEGGRGGSELALANQRLGSEHVPLLQIDWKVNLGHVSVILCSASDSYM